MFLSGAWNVAKNSKRKYTRKTSTMGWGGRVVVEYTRVFESGLGIAGVHSFQSGEGSTATSSAASGLPSNLLP